MRRILHAAKLLHRIRRDRRGHFAVMSAIMLPVAVVLAAAAVDTGSLYLEKRRAQGLVDLAAMTAAANLQNAEEAVRLVFKDNGIHNIAIGTMQEGRRIAWRPGIDVAAIEDQAIIWRGEYTSSPAIDPKERFASPPASGSGRTNAVKVTYRTIGSRHFGAALIPPPQIVVEGTAATSVSAAFSVGSRLLQLDGGITNSLLSGLTGSSVALSVMDYNALLGADISLLSFIDALATELDLTAASYSEVLDADVSVGQVARAVARVDGIGPDAQAAARKLGLQAGGAKAAAFPLARLIGFDKEVARAVIHQVGADVSVMQLLTMGAVLAGKGKQVGLDLGANVPGLLSVSVDLAIGEPPQQSPWFTIGGGGEVVRTAQTRLRVVAEIGNHNALTALLGARIRIPLYLELAYAEARLQSIACPTGRPESVEVKVAARPGIANLYLAEVDPKRIVNFANPAPRSPARLVQLAVISVTGQAQAETAAMTYKNLSFSRNDIDAGRIRQVSTNTILTSLTTSLFSSLSLQVKVELGLLGLPLLTLPSNAISILGQTIGTAAPAIDGLLNELLKLLGLSLGQADVRVHGATCGRAVLVQ